MTGAALADLYDEINQKGFTPSDRLLQGGSRHPLVYRLAGARFYRAEVIAAAGHPEQAHDPRLQAYNLLGVQPPDR